jgi:hypothetical protein
MVRVVMPSASRLSATTGRCGPWTSIGEQVTVTTTFAGSSAWKSVAVIWCQ